MKPLIRGIKLSCNGDSRLIEFKYENLSLFYFYCGKVSHGIEYVIGKKRTHKPQFSGWISLVSG